MTYPGSPPGDSGEQQPPPHHEPVPGAYEYPPIDMNKGDQPPAYPPPAGHQAPPPGYQAPPPVDYSAGYSASPQGYPAPPPQNYSGAPQGYPPPAQGYPPPPGYQSGYPGGPPQAFPPNNGYNQYQPGYGGQFPPTYGSGQPSTNNIAIASLATSLVGIPLFFLCFGVIGFLCFIAGVVLGIVALNQLGKSPQKGKELAIAGIGIGGVCILGSILLVLLVASSAAWY